MTESECVPHLRHHHCHSVLHCHSILYSTQQQSYSKAKVTSYFIGGKPYALEHVLLFFYDNFPSESTTVRIHQLHDNTNVTNAPRYNTPY